MKYKIKLQKKDGIKNLTRYGEVYHSALLFYDEYFFETKLSVEEILKFPYVESVNIITDFRNSQNNKEDDNMEERFEKFIKENQIEVDDEGNFEMYVVVSKKDTDHEEGVVICKEGFCTTKELAFNCIKEYGACPRIKFLSTENVEDTDEKLTIKEDLLTMEYKVFKVLINKSNIKNILYSVYDRMEVTKYKVIEEIKLDPKLKFKISSFNKTSTHVILYNDITGKNKVVCIDYFDNIPPKTINDLRAIVRSYLKNNEREVELYNTIIALDGAEI